MTINGYTRLQSGYWVRDIDNAGPFTFDGTATFTLASGGGGGGGGDASAGNQTTQITAVNLTNTRTGDLAEAAPASDTASSGLNGRLQRIAQRITSLIALLPVSLGIKTAAGSLSVVPASDAVYSVASSPATLTDRSGTITAGGTAQQLEASAATRRGYSVQNHSVGDLWASTLATAVASQPSIRIPPGALYETPMGGGGTGAISLIGATTGQAFTARTWV